MSVVANENLRAALTDGQRIEARRLGHMIDAEVHDLHGAVTQAHSWNSISKICSQADHAADLLAETASFLRSLIS